ncbi:MAG: CNNM domain-containing protein [Kiritimatiellia bacterium]|jgi:putative hemolysin
MNPYDYLTLLAILLGHVLCAFFAGMETGVTSMNRLRLLHRARNGSRPASVLEGFRRDMDRLLVTSLVWSNVINVAISTLAASFAARRWGGWGQTAAAVVISITVLVFGEYLPKAWFYSRPLERCLPFAYPLRVAEILVKPVGSVITRLMQWILPIPPHHDRRPTFSRENLAHLARESEDKGQISALERLMIDRVLALQYQTAADRMTPLDRVAKVFHDTPLRECGRIARASGHLKLPVFDATGKTCVGILRLRSMLTRAATDTKSTASEHMVPPFFVEAGMCADDVLPELRRNHRHMAIVRDAGGNAVGIITVEDCLAGLVGNLPVGVESERINRSPAL